jgi:hypothetical protein
VDDAQLGIVRYPCLAIFLALCDLQVPYSPLRLFRNPPSPAPPKCTCDRQHDPMSNCIMLELHSVDLLVG